MKKKLFPTAVILAVFVLFLCLIPRQKNASEYNISLLSELTGRYFKEELNSSTLNLHYTLADPAAYGITDHVISFGAVSGPDLTHARILTENYQSSLEEIDRSVLPAQEQFTYDVLAYTLDRTQKNLDWYYYQEPLSPSLGIQAQLPILLAEYAFYRESDITDYLELLRQTEDYFASILAFEHEKSQKGLFMSDETLNAIISQCIDFINSAGESYLEELFEEKLAALPEIPTARRQLYRTRHKQILETCFYPAYEQLVNGLTALKGSGTNEQGLCGLYDGKAYYTHLISTITGTDRSPSETWDLLTDKRNEYASGIQNLLAHNPELLSADTSLPAAHPADILKALEQAVSKDFPALPATTTRMKEVHPSLQQHSSPAFYLTPPLDRMQENTIYINPADNYTGIDLFTTLAHEGFPGHLYQTVYSHANCRNPLQSLINIGGYTEGWATYAEMYSYDLSGLIPSAAEFLRLNKAWTLNLYCAVDVGVHYYGWTSYDIYEFLSGYGADDSAICEEIFHTVIEDPGNYLRYYIGYLEFESLRARASQALGDNFDLKEYHQTLLSLGPAPFFLLQEGIDAYIAEKD